MASRHQLRRPGTALDDVRNALQAAGHSIRSRGREAFMASCPLHTDRSPSLSVGGAKILAPGLAERSCCTALAASPPPTPSPPPLGCA